MSNMKLGEIFGNKAIEDFGTALRKAVRDERSQDYASLIELEYVEKPEEFAEAVKKFLRRYDSYAKKYKIIRPSDDSLIEMMKLVDLYGVRVIRAALIAHALVKAPTEEVTQGGEINE
ncbi:MAG: hypothetical protein H5T41_02750 [Methanomassiliicoccales archaeon]|nr:hypothetical protein [Methanomassiliicoccales archaeon]